MKKIPLLSIKDGISSKELIESLRKEKHLLLEGTQYLIHIDDGKTSVFDKEIALENILSEVHFRQGVYMDDFDAKLLLNGMGVEKDGKYLFFNFKTNQILLKNKDGQQVLKHRI